MTSAWIVLHAGPAWAGMGLSPFQRLFEEVRLGAVAQMRLEAISFFTVVLLVLAAAVMGVWNAFRKDFPVLPRLSYLKALGLLLVWGLAMSLVLSMITGARELMTPGVWERAGALYRIGGDKPQSEADQIFQMRQANLQRLGRALARYAESHGGRFPPNEFVPEISDDLWHTLAHTGDRYEYLTGQSRLPTGETPAAPLAYEPTIYGQERLVLLTDGAVRRMTRDEIGERYFESIRSKLPPRYVGPGQ